MSLSGNLSLAEVHMAPLSVRQFTAYVGIDWGDTKHDICLQASGDDKREFDCIPHQVARIDEWARVLHQRFGGPIAVALELARGPIVAALQKYEVFVLFPINPWTLARYRQAFKPGQGRSHRCRAGARSPVAPSGAVCPAQAAERCHAFLAEPDRTAPGTGRRQDPVHQ